jgi:hypothetical protein
MNQRTYTEQTLPKVVAILKKEGIALQEDRNSTHHGKISNSFKKELGITSFQTPTCSPNLSVAETFARPLKSLYASRGHYQKEEAQKYLVDYFYSIKQEDIQKWILSIPSRLKRVRDSGGESLPEW